MLKRNNTPVRLAKETTSKLTLTKSTLISGICVVTILLTVAYFIGPMNPIEHVATLI